MQNLRDFSEIFAHELSFVHISNLLTQNRKIDGAQFFFGLDNKQDFFLEAGDLFYSIK